MTSRETMRNLPVAVKLGGIRTGVREKGKKHASEKTHTASTRQTEDYVRAGVGSTRSFDLVPHAT
jgi:hypothetical protein